MKSLLLFLVLALGSFGCSQKLGTENKESQQGATTTHQKEKSTSGTSPKKLNDLFTLTDAERIMGEATHVTDSTMGTQQGLSAYKSSYTSTAKSEKAGTVNFLVEEFRQLADAQNKYSFIKASHESHAGFTSLKGIGDEAYMRSDNINMQFFMVRKGLRVMSIRMNKPIDKSVLKDFERVTKDVAERL